MTRPRCNILSEAACTISSHWRARRSLSVNWKAVASHTHHCSVRERQSTAISPLSYSKSVIALTARSAATSTRTPEAAAAKSRQPTSHSSNPNQNASLPSWAEASERIQVQHCIPPHRDRNPRYTAIICARAFCNWNCRSTVCGWKPQFANLETSVAERWREFPESQGSLFCCFAVVGGSSQGKGDGGLLFGGEMCARGDYHRGFVGE